VSISTTIQFAQLLVGLFAHGVKLPQFAVIYSIASYKLPLAGETFIRLDTIDLAIFLGDF
jgi:hypothetical protein